MSPLSFKFYAWLLVTKLTTRVISLTLIERSFFPYKSFFPHWAHADSSFVGASGISQLYTVPYNHTFGAPD